MTRFRKVTPQMATPPDPPPALRPLREALAESRISASKSFGQHFLLDLNITRKIVRTSPAIAGRDVLEIGAGPGGLTRAILEAAPRKLVAVEKDRRFGELLNELKLAYPGRFDIHEGDAMESKEDDLFDGRREIVVIANLPYNISTALLIKWVLCDRWPPWYSDLVLMFQKEVADRILSPPGRKSYGRLSVMTQFRMTARKLFDVPASAFVPPPKVNSTILHLMPRPEADSPVTAQTLETILRHAFGQRRKMLKTSLRPLGGDVLNLLEHVGIAPTARAEEVDVETYANLAAFAADQRRQGS